MNVKVLARCSALTLSLFMCLGFAYQAHAISVTGSAGPNFPVEVEVGQSYTRFYQMVNTSTDDSGNPLAGNVEATDIRMTPSCGSTNNPNFCDAGSEDNGVFAPLVFSGSSLAAPCDLAPCGLGRTGTACAGNRFAISVVAGAINTASDEWLFTPLDGDVLLGTPLTADALCTIDFDMEVLMLPTIDSRGDTGIQTDLKGTADYLHIPTQTQGAGQGGSFTTVIGCGDGVVQSSLGETCDPSVFVDPGDWLASVPPVFGDLADLRDCREPGTTGECTYCGDDDVQVVDAGPPPFEGCDDGNSVDTDGCTNECLLGACSVEITKEVAPDDNCDGAADGPFGEFVQTDPEACVVYEICVTNTGQQVLNTGGVEVSDTHLGIVSVDFGTIGVGGEECKLVASEISASECTGPGGSCVCEDVEGVNTAVVTSAICQGTGADACSQLGSDCDDTAEVDCIPCSVEIDKQVALDDNCDGVADGPFGEDVTQTPDKCVVYEICVTNTGQQALNTGGVEVSDTHLGIVSVDFGTIGVGGEECKFVASEVPATDCVDDICVCEDVEGVNTAEITSAICQTTGKSACDDPASDCDDIAEVACADCSVEIDKQVALDDNCDGVADGPFGDLVTQDEGECVVYEICVTNTGDQILNTGGVEVSDTHLGIVSVDFGTIGVGGEECKFVASEVTATDCPGGVCVCENVEGVNTAEVTSAICQDTGDNACDQTGSDCDDIAEVVCVSCSVEIEKKVALDDDCDGVADGPFGEDVTQDPDKCVVYEICVTNTGEQVLNTGGVEVSDTHLGIVDLDFGTIGVGGEECKLVASEASAEACVDDICVCEDVEGVNTAEVTSAICELTGKNACADEPPSDCDDTAEVDCAKVVGICRTPGFWGTHGCPQVVDAAGNVLSNDCDTKGDVNITQEVIDAGGGCLEVCGEVITNTAVWSENSALEAICSTGANKLVKDVYGANFNQLARQLTAAALNFVISGTDESGTGLWVDEYFDDCNNLCAGGVEGSDPSVNECIYAIDCFNNGWVLDDSDNCVPPEGVCVSMSEQSDIACTSDDDCTAEYPYCNADNCHERLLCNLDLDDGICFEWRAESGGLDCDDPSAPVVCLDKLGGNTGSSKICNEAKKITPSDGPNAKECLILWDWEEDCPEGGTALEGPETCNGF